MPLYVRHNLGQAVSLARDLRRVLHSGRGIVAGALYAGALEYGERIEKRGFFYSKAVRSTSGGRVPNARSRGRARASIRALRSGETRFLYPSGDRFRGKELVKDGRAGLIMGEPEGAKHAGVLEGGRKRRRQQPGATGPLPPQRIFGRGMRRFAIQARDRVTRRFVRGLRFRYSGWIGSR